MGERLSQVFDVRATCLDDGFALVWRDVTNQHLAHTALTQANEDLLRRVNQLGTLNLIAQTLASTHDLNASMKTVCNAIAARTGASSVTIVGFASDQPIASNAGETLPDRDPITGIIAIAPDAFGTLTWSLLTQRRLISLARNAPDFPLDDALLRRLQCAEAAHMLLVPLTSAADSLGLLVLGSGPSDMPFSAEEQSVLETMAGQIATALSNARLAEQAQQSARLAERNRVARDLHDSATQALYSLSLLAGGWAQQAEQGQLDAISTKLTQLKEIALQVLKELRLLIYELRHPQLAEGGLVKALEERLAAVEQRSSVHVSLRVNDEANELPLQCAEHVYIMLQEALNNTLRHGQAQVVSVTIRRVSDALVFAVQDDGIGFDPAAPSSGLGLRSMRERAQAIGGHLVVTSATGRGTLVEIKVPVPDSNRG